MQSVCITSRLHHISYDKNAYNKTCITSVGAALAATVAATSSATSRSESSPPAASPVPATRELKDVVVVCRHGARTPVHNTQGFPQMPFKCSAKANEALPKVEVRCLKDGGPR